MAAEALTRERAEQDRRRSELNGTPPTTAPALRQAGFVEVPWYMNLTHQTCDLVSISWVGGIPIALINPAAFDVKWLNYETGQEQVLDGLTGQPLTVSHAGSVNYAPPLRLGDANLSTVLRSWAGHLVYDMIPVVPLPTPRG
jgi:hypothetical protein